MKKGKNIQLGPLCLSKTQYKPYSSSSGLKTGFKSKHISDSEVHRMIEMPPIQQTNTPLEQNQTKKLKLKISKIFESQVVKFHQSWKHYIDKSNIVLNGSPDWKELQIYLLRIIMNLLNSQLKLKDQVEGLKKYESSSISENPMLNQTNPSNYRLCKKLELSHLNQNSGSLTHNQICKNTNLNSVGCFNRSGNNKIFSANQTFLSTLNPNIRQSDQSSEDGALQIVYLYKKIEVLESQLKKSEQNIGKKLKEQYDDNIQKLKTEYNQLHEEKLKYENEVEGKKFHNNILVKQFKILKEKYFQLQDRYKQLLVTNTKGTLRQQGLKEYLRYKQLWLMQNQETLQLMYDLRILKKEKENQVKKNMGLKQKLKELSKNFNYNYNVTFENQKDKQDLNKVLKDFRDWLKFIAVPRISKGMFNNNSFFPEMNLDSFEEKIDSYLPKEDQTNYKLLRPNFFIYFEAYESIIISERKFPQRKIMPPDFFLTIRGILDSMYLHLTFSADFLQWKNFPDFTISFIEKFEIHPQQRVIVIRKNQCQGEEKINFLLNIFNLEAANTWECDIFRNFLMEECTLDEIYFYLDCRNSLLKGPQLNSNFGSPDTITYISIDDAYTVIREKLDNYDSEMFDRIKKFITSKRKTKNNKYFIDLNFVLKLLLQVYSIEKIKSEKFFFQSFKSKEKDSKITYTEYSIFMSKNFSFLTKSDISKLFRQIYALGVGRITYKTIHFICLVRGLFIPLIRQKIYKNKNNGSKKEKILEDALFLNMQNQGYSLNQGLEHLGVQEIVGIDLSINLFLNDSSELRKNKQVFQVRFLQLTEKITKIKAILSWKNKRIKKTTQITRDQLRQRVGQLLAYSYQCLQDIQDMKKHRDQRKNAIDKLTRNFKIRIQQSFLQFKLNGEQNFTNKLLSLNEKQDEQNLIEEQQNEES